RPDGDRRSGPDRKRRFRRAIRARAGARARRRAPGRRTAGPHRADDDLRDADGSIRRQPPGARPGVAAVDGIALSGDGARGNHGALRSRCDRGNRGDRGAAVKTPTSFIYAHDPASGVAIITLNRPDRLNALTFAVYEEL